VRAGYVGVGLFAAVGVIASIGRGGNWASPIPSCIAGVVTAIVLTVLIKQSLGDPQAAAAAVESGGVASQRVALANDRRRFLRTSAAVAASSLAVGAAGRWFMTQGTAAAERLKIVLPKAARPLPPVSPAVTVDAPGVAPFLTPNDQFYRIDTALVVPRVRAESWKLTVGGMVDQPITLTYEELLARPMIEADITIACVSNEVGGNLVGTARWLGCRLDDLLAEAGIQPAADQIVGRSVDGFTAGFPTALLDGRDALVAVGMNGEPLPARSGFPARLIVPGVYGYVSATKWLSEIQLTTFAEFEGYWIPRGWSVEAPVKTQSRIDTPQQGRVLEAGTTVAIAGVAWAPIRGIKNVEVRIDREPWSPAQLGDEHAATTWRQWSMPWTPSKGNHTLSVRATDGTGVTQTGEVAEVAPDGATGWHTITVRAV